MTARSYSLVRRTVLAVVAVQLACAVLLCGAALLHERHTRLRSLDVRLEGRSDSVLGAIQDAEDPDDNVTLDPAELKLPPDDVYAVYNRGGRRLGSSVNAPGELVERHAQGFREGQAGRERFRVYERDAMRIIDRPENGGVGLRRPVTIVYATPEWHLWHEIFEAVRFYLLAIALATAFTVFAVALLLRRSLRPLGELAATAAQLGPRTLVFRAPQSVLRVRELQPLAQVLATSVDRLREAFSKEQRFVGDAAHELKTAIAVVRSQVQLVMLRPRSEAEYRAGLARVLEDNRRVEALVAQMLELARVEETAAQPAPLLDVAESARLAAAVLEPILAERGVVVRVDAACTVHVRLGQDRALALLTNLLLNAAQHSPRGGQVVVAIGRIQSGAGDGRQAGGVQLQVTDHGSGIAPDALPHLFERFFREDRSRSRDTGGTGLGLPICKAIVEGAGGTIHIASEPGQGTRVTMLFPAGA